MTHPVWHGVRLRVAEVGADPDAAARPVTIPASWPDAAAAGLAALFPQARAVRLPDAARAWIGAIPDAALGARLHALLLRRRGAPDAATWRGLSSNCPGFSLNLAAFVAPDDGFDVDGFAGAVADATAALMHAHPRAPRLAVGFCDLFGMFARMGIDPGAADAAATAGALASLMRSVADRVSAAGAVGPASAWPVPGGVTAIPGLARAAADAHERAAGLRPAHAATTAITLPGPECAVLGAEAGASRRRTARWTRTDS